MTAARAGSHEGEVREVVAEAGLDTDEPRLEFASRRGKVNSDLTVGADVTRAKASLANEGICSPGVKLHGAGFIVTPAEAELLGLGRRPGLEQHIREYRNGRDLTAHPRGVMVIDLFGLTAEEVRRRYPEVYQHLLATVKPERDANNRASYRDNWWVFGEPRRDLRPALARMPRYIATVETAKHRIFQFVDGSVLADNKLICIASAKAEHLAILASRPHQHWYSANSAMIGVFDQDAVYVKSRCFDPFPFPELSDAVRATLRCLGEELDATRKTVQAEHPDLTLTGLYNVLEKVRASEPLSDKDQDVKDRGRVLILNDLHDQIDRATAGAYGWPHDLSDEAILERLVALNAERAKEEAAGQVRWLRPDYQIPRFAKGAKAKSGELDLGTNVVALDKGLPLFPKDKSEQPLALLAALSSANRPLDAAALSRGFKGGGKKIEQRVAQALTTLVRYGRIEALDNGTFAARRAA